MRRYSLLLIMAMFACTKSDWQPAESPLVTPWTHEVDPTNPRPEYPRTMMRRNEWLNLNGLWEYSIVPRDSMPHEYEGNILVPFAVESALSGVGDTVGEANRLWYRRDIAIPESWSGNRILLHFEAVDWETQVWVNGQDIGIHHGGYDPFSFDITNALAGEGDQELVVAVWDPTDGGTQPRGKQVSDPGGIFYTSVTGIWQTVWLEPVPTTAIVDFVATPDIDASTVTVVVEAAGAASDYQVEIDVLENEEVIVRASGDVDAMIALSIENAQLWSPDDPHLYDLDIRLSRDGAVVDEVAGYFGMREISVGKDSEGTTRLLLNDEFVFQAGPLDQGYWPDGLYTAPTEEAMVYDLEVIKAMGFNMLRKHVKVEPRSFYTWCDRMGILVWQDMPNANIPVEPRGSDVSTDREATVQFETELRALVETHRNHPSIVMWVPFNEGWGQYDSGRITELVRAADATRLVNHASGWYERGFGDVVDRHSYPAPNPPEPEATRAAVQGEFGGLGYNVAAHMWTSEGWGYDLFPDRESLAREFEELMSDIRRAVERGLSAAVYTQTTDIETENNGLLTYDREVAKIDPETVALANQGYLPPRVTNRATVFVDRTAVELVAPIEASEIRYTTDGTEPTRESASYETPFDIEQTTTVKSRAFWEDGQESRTSTYTLERVQPVAAVDVAAPRPGLTVEVYDQDGSWNSLPDFDALSPDLVEQAHSFEAGVAGRQELYGLRFRGFIRVTDPGVYGFHLISDDGSRLLVGGEEIVDNDGVHGVRERSGFVALEAGFHAVELLFFQGRGGVELRLEIASPNQARRDVPAELLFHE
ncbi:MAG: chitobiase/beta-hexosaminidase C-terminal domain-containing protein [Gemmatimonadota bacterium]|nr:MAG: chitobiase/beta-hexosaminidase C-terminal domain-containing protein [Gemmatimonadota bacterium]